MTTQIATQKEFAFTDADFKRITRLIYEAAGISLTGAKREMAYSRVARRLRATGHTSFEAYLNMLDSDAAHDEWQNFINALTTNLTSFFREEHHFPILLNYLKTHPTPITIWCCAASTGEEPYTIAMTACEAFNTLTPPVKIIATDIDTNVLATAEQGVYPEERINKLSQERISRFFLRGKGARSGMVKVRPELGKLISFKALNLLSSQWDVSAPLDIIFCRNVMIYFDKDTQRTILKRFEPLLRPGGLLFAGHSENFAYVTTGFKLEGKTVYTRVLDNK